MTPIEIDVDFLRRLIVAYLKEMAPGQAGHPSGGCAPSVGQCLDFYAGVMVAKEGQRDIGPFEDSPTVQEPYRCPDALPEFLPPGDSEEPDPTPSEEPQGPEAPPTHTHTHTARPRTQTG